MRFLRVVVFRAFDRLPDFPLSFYCPLDARRVNITFFTPSNEEDCYVRNSSRLGGYNRSSRRRTGSIRGRSPQHSGNARSAAVLERHGNRHVPSESAQSSRRRLASTAGENSTSRRRRLSSR